MSQAPDYQQKIDELIKLLVEQKIISSPQADIAQADVAVTGMSLDEVLIARRWVTEEKLYTLAPWLKQPHLVAAAQTPAQVAAPLEPSSAQTTTPEDAAKTPAAIPQPSEDGKTSSDNFEENLRKYRELMSEILGEAN